MDFIKKTSESVVIGIPSKWRMKDHTYDFLRSKGIDIKETGDRKLQTTLGDDRFKVCFMHAKDIAIMLENGLIDVWFTGLDIIYETRVKSVRPVIKTGLGKVKLCIAVPNNSSIDHPFKLMDKKIATSFWNITKEYFGSLWVNVDVHNIFWASEWMPYLWLCDAIVDVVETWNSLVANNMQIIRDDLFLSELVVAVNKPELSKNYKVVNEFLRKIY